jgi:DNA-binding HxlR family transcriptional regulator
VVRYIFELACGGQSLTQIAKTLNNEGTLTPSDYKKQNGSNINIKSSITGSVWSGYGVANILHNEHYTGVLLGGKSEPAGPIRIHNAHPAIVSADTWQTAAAKRSRFGKSGKHGSPNPDRALYKRVRCGYCNHVMRYRAGKNGGKYFCGWSRHADNHGCLAHKYPEQWVMDAVKAVIKKLIADLLNTEESFRNEKKDVGTWAKQPKNNIISPQTLKRQLYERYKDGILDKESYLKKCESLKTSKDKRAGEACQPTTKSAAKTINTLIKSVYILDKDRIEIKFSFFIVTT